ncbi:MULTISPECIES: recombinase family protein [Brevibacterium]|jgi:site-specific DNA recombinase|uniref:Recombinase domain-containing protein n=2 Tax=Brevibacterium TaxID=1696 RepID=A0A2A3YYC6_BREAU|nr:MULTISPECIES: recombinase family protein [Brevibacterium]MDN5586689.1 recombinase family protein [Brevibacterium sp.]PCC44271.1 hypothetical protein CIK65_01330 [Brevibacterium aurantiacum]SMX96453.1 Site-specific DNA recombinase [Brevibacterium antiquum CNRZ 918]HCG55823.1 recombinase family protein [Brevibacterium sp.]
MAELVWGGYARISEDPRDERSGVRRQREDIDAEIVRRGGESLDEARFYLENDTSAYKRKRVTITDEYGEQRQAYRVIRPVWAQALRDLRAGVITALAVYDLDRLARDPRDLEDAIEVVQHHGSLIISATSAGTDLMSDSGRAMARVMVTMAQKSSADTARRVARAHLESAHEGRPVGGSRPFGFLADKVTHCPVEAPLVRKAAQDIIDGASIRGIAEEWAAAGIKTVRGGAWNRSVIRHMLSNPRLAGWRVHQGKIATDRDGKPVRLVQPQTLAVVGEDGKPARAKNPRAGEPVEPLLDQDTFDRLQEALVRPDNRKVKPRRGARRYLLSGLVRCAVCHRQMYGNRWGETGGEMRFYYVCQGGADDKHAVSVSGHGTDAFLERVVLDRLAVEDMERPAPEFSGDGRLAQVKEAITELMSVHRTGLLSGSVVFPQVQQLQEEQERLEAERGEFIRATAGPTTARVTPEVWAGMSTDKRRAIVETLIEAVLIHPGRQRQNKLDYDRIEVVWRQD